MTLNCAGLLFRGCGRDGIEELGGYAQDGQAILQFPSRRPVHPLLANSPAGVHCKRRRAGGQPVGRRFGRSVRHYTGVRSVAPSTHSTPPSAHSTPPCAAVVLETSVICSSVTPALSHRRRPSALSLSSANRTCLFPCVCLLRIISFYSLGPFVGVVTAIQRRRLPPPYRRRRGISYRSPGSS